MSSDRTPTSSKLLQAGVLAGDRYAKPVEVIKSGTNVSEHGHSPRLKYSGMAFALRRSFTHGDHSENRIEHVVESLPDVLD